MPSTHSAHDVILALAAERGPGKTFCPSEAARRMAEDWRPLMPEIRRVADALAAQGQLHITQGGETVEAETAEGPIRLGLPGKAP